MCPGFTSRKFYHSKPEPEEQRLELVQTGYGIFLLYVLLLLSFPPSSTNTVAQVMITPIIINRLQWKAYLIFMATNFAFVPIIYFLYPETSNLTLEEVDHIFAGDENPIAVAKLLQRQLAQNGHIDVESPLQARVVVDDSKEGKYVEHVES